MYPVSTDNNNNKEKKKGKLNILYPLGLTCFLFCHYSFFFFSFSIL